jgi:hypothetical protein
MGPGLFLTVVNSAHQVSSNYASIRGFYDYSKEHNMNFLSPQRVERGFLTGYGDREIEDSISLTKFAKAIRRVYSVR